MLVQVYKAFIPCVNLVLSVCATIYVCLNDDCLIIWYMYSWILLHAYIFKTTVVDLIYSSLTYVMPGF